MGFRTSLWRLLLVDRLGVDRLSDQEEDLAARFVTEMETALQAHGVYATPFVVLRVHDVLASMLVALRLERESIALEAGPDAMRQRTTVIELAGKARERLRKAMKELEDTCAKMGTPIDQGLDEVMNPIIEAGEGILEDALAFEESKRRKAAAGNVAEPQTD